MVVAAIEKSALVTTAKGLALCRYNGPFWKFAVEPFCRFTKAEILSPPTGGTTLSAELNSLHHEDLQPPPNALGLSISYFVSSSPQPLDSRRGTVSVGRLQL